MPGGSPRVCQRLASAVPLILPWDQSLHQTRGDSAVDLTGLERAQEVSDDDDRLPFDDASFDLVTSQHPVRPDWGEISRVLAPGGRYFAQHVGPASAFELIEYFLGPLPEVRQARDPARESAAAEAAGSQIVDLRTARPRMEFCDVGAIVWVLRKCVWWVPDFSVARYREELRELDARLRSVEPCWR